MEGKLKTPFRFTERWCIPSSSKIRLSADFLYPRRDILARSRSIAAVGPISALPRDAADSLAASMRLFVARVMAQRTPLPAIVQSETTARFRDICAPQSRARCAQRLQRNACEWWLCSGSDDAYVLSTAAKCGSPRLPLFADDLIVDRIDQFVRESYAVV
jgi:hypothetical protein